MRRVAGRDDELLFGSGLRGGAALLPAGDGSGDDRPLVPVDGVRHEDRTILILGERAALDHGVELVAPPAARETGGRIRTGGLEHGKSGGALGRVAACRRGRETIGRSSGAFDTLVHFLDRRSAGCETRWTTKEAARGSPQTTALARATGQSLGDSGPVARAPELLDLLAKERILLRNSARDVRCWSVGRHRRGFHGLKSVASAPLGRVNPIGSTPWWPRKKLFLTVVGRGPEWRRRRREKVSRRRVERTSGVHEFFTILSSSSVTLLIVA